MPSKIYIFAGGHKIAEGEGEVMAADGSLGSAFDTLKAKTGIAAKSMQEMADAYNSIKLREKMTVPEVPFPKEIPELSFRVKISKRRLRRLRQQLKFKSRLPRKLKKAARHLKLDEYDVKPIVNKSTDTVKVTLEMDITHCLHTRPAGYPRTKWVQRLIHRWLREMNQMHKRFVKRAMFEQYLDQHPGMLTYDPAPLTPSPEVADMLRRGDVAINPYYPHAQEMVLDRKHLTNLANIINNKEDEK